MATPQVQGNGMLAREQLLHLFDRFCFLTSQPEVKKRIADAVQDKQEAVAVTTAIQEEIFLEMGIDPRYGIACLGKVSTVYENDLDLVIQFYKFIAKEEIACDEAELGPDEFSERMLGQQKLQEKQLEMLKYMRKFPLDDQSAILDKIHQQMENGNYESESSILSTEQIQEINVQRKASPLFMPRGITPASPRLLPKSHALGWVYPKSRNLTFNKAFMDDNLPSYCTVEARAMGMYACTSVRHSHI